MRYGTMVEANAGSEGGHLLSVELSSLDHRLRKLEDGEKKTPFKRLLENAGACALLLGLVLTLFSLYDVLVAKPEADRISRISSFNEAVNAAAKKRQDLIRTELDTAADPGLKIAMQMAATPQILNDAATARAILRDLKDGEVE